MKAFIHPALGNLQPVKLKPSLVRHANGTMPPAIKRVECQLNAPGSRQATDRMVAKTVPGTPRHGQVSGMCSNTPCCPWLFRFSRGVVTAREVCEALDISRAQVRKFLELGLWLTAEVGLPSTVSGIQQNMGQRRSQRVLRFSIEAWMLNQLEAQGSCPPHAETAEVTWWRHELKKRRV